MATTSTSIFRALTIAVVVVLAGGTIFYHFVEGWSWLNSLYFCVITLTTIGYGDFAPTMDISKLFTIFYVLTGVGILAAYASTYVKRLGERRNQKRNKQ